MLTLIRRANLAGKFVHRKHICVLECGLICMDTFFSYNRIPGKYSSGKILATLPKNHESKANFEPTNS